jgi:hypothetical protein
MTRARSSIHSLDLSPEDATAPDGLAPELCDSEGGALDASRVSALFGLASWIVDPSGQAQGIVEVGPSVLATVPISILTRIACPLLRLVGTPEALRVWMNAPNPDLGGATPLSFVEDALVGQPG